MAADFEDLRVLQLAENVSDDLWKRIVRWDAFTRDVVGKQLARAADSIGANIAEAFGRFHFGEKLQFLYFGRGSLFETKYWLNRAKSRGLLSEAEVTDFASRLTALARQLNAFAASLRTMRSGGSGQWKPLKEESASYGAVALDDPASELFDRSDLAWLES